MGSRGTPDYMAPECWGVVNKYSPKVDVWSLGVIFFMMITGKTPTSHLVDSEQNGIAEEEEEGSGGGSGSDDDDDDDDDDEYDGELYLGLIANGTAKVKGGYFAVLDKALEAIEVRPHHLIVQVVCHSHG